MGEVKRFAFFFSGGPPHLDECEGGPWVSHDDYARLERERDVFLADKTRLEHQHNEDARQLSYQAAELPRLRAVEAAAQEYKQSMAGAIEEDRPEWKRLHAIEVAARDMLAKLDSEGCSGPYMRALAEACGRKG